MKKLETEQIANVLNGLMGTIEIRENILSALECIIPGVSKNTLKKISGLMSPNLQITNYEIIKTDKVFSVKYTFDVREKLSVKFSLGFGNAHSGFTHSAEEIISHLHKQRSEFDKAYSGAKTFSGLRDFLRSNLKLEYDRQLTHEVYVITTKKSVAILDKIFAFELSDSDIKTDDKHFEKYIIDNAIIADGFIMEDFGIVKAGVKITDLGKLCRTLFQNLYRYSSASISYKKITEPYFMDYDVPIYDIELIKKKDRIEELTAHGNQFECAYLYVHTNHYPARMKYARGVISGTDIDLICGLIKENAITPEALKKRIGQAYFDYVTMHNPLQVPDPLLK